MDESIVMETTDFDKDIAELVHIGDDLRLFEEQKNELEKENERLETMHLKLTEQMIEQQMDWNEKYTV